MTQAFSFADLGNTNKPSTLQLSRYITAIEFYLKAIFFIGRRRFHQITARLLDRTTNAFRILVGTERALIGIRDSGIIVIVMTKFGN